MVERYFDIRPDPDAGAWFLDTPTYPSGEEILGNEFRQGKRWESDRTLSTRIYTQGNSVDFSRGGRGTIFVSSFVVDLLMADMPEGLIQGVPVEISDCHARYKILNVLDVVDCIDEGRSEFGKWKEQDGRPEMIGRYRGIPKMVIDCGKTFGHSLFLVKNWEVCMLCSSRVRDALLDAGVTGVQFVPVDSN